MCEWRSYLKYVLILKICIQLSIGDKMPGEKSHEVISDSYNFGIFLKNLGAMVYKTNKMENVENETHSTQQEPFTSTISTPSKLWIINEDDDHRDAFRDMLMLKLVSYYENKYKVSHAELITTTPGAVPSLEETTTKSETISTTKSIYDQNYFSRNSQSVDEVITI